ncbi:RidA family protein [Curtobacterium albidum]|uniref:RidA family protein n=1 Tax=Curtobacterium citreum TaxID=2036 RepID=A0A850DUQ4_9MICO|nr:Rid family hydrolase [Curtobacterium albidum]NUU27193.1 RidA family protein [Curtobacterium albidum]
MTGTTSTDEFERFVPPGMEDGAVAFGLAPGIRCGNLVFVSGQLGIDADGTIPADGARQAELAIAAVTEVLEAAGCSLRDIIQLQTFQVGGMATTNEWFLPVKDRFFPAPFPSWTGVGVADLGGDGAVIEIGAIARVPH